MAKSLCRTCENFSTDLYCEGIKIPYHGYCFQDDTVMDYDTYMWIQECDFYSENGDETPAYDRADWDDD